MSGKHFLILIFTVLITVSCGSRKATVSEKMENTSPERSPRTTNQTEARETIGSTSYADVIAAYIAVYAPIAQEEMRLYKIPASITLAQGILESGAGRGTLSRTANNHFGIKCHDWTGDRVYHDDDASQECFRKYTEAKFSYRDHSLFLSQRSRYRGLFDLNPDDYEGWAKGLRAAGYATDRLYPQKLVDIINRYHLYRYDEEVLGYRSKPVQYAVTNRDAYVVKQGDTLYSIAKRFNTTVQQLQEYNNLSDYTISIGQELQVEPASKNQ